MRKIIYILVVAFMTIFLVSGCSKATVTKELKLDSSSNPEKKPVTVTVTYPKDGFDSLYLPDLMDSKEAADKAKLEKYNPIVGRARTFTSVVYGPKYVISITNVHSYFDKGDTAGTLKGEKGTLLKDVSYGGTKGFLYTCSDIKYPYLNYRYINILLPYAEAGKNYYGSALEIRVCTNEQLALAAKVYNKEIKESDPAWTKANQDLVALIDNKELEEILKSIKINIPEKK